MEALPEAIRGLTSLEALWLQNNLLKDLTPALGDLGRLTLLDVAVNALEAFPMCLTRLIQ